MRVIPVASVDGAVGVPGTEVALRRKHARHVGEGIEEGRIELMCDRRQHHAAGLAESRRNRFRPDPARP